MKGPLVWGTAHSDRKRCLQHLQKLNGDAYPVCDDPIWRARRELRFDTGVKSDSDDRILISAVEEYHERGLGCKAVRLRTMIGQWMARETVSHQERCGWSPDLHLRALRSDCERAGLHARLPALNIDG